MIDDTTTDINRPVRLHRHRPLALTFARLILTGLTHPIHTPDGPTYQAAQLVLITHNHVDTIEPLLGERFTAGPTWHLHTTLVLPNNEPIADLIRAHSPLAHTLRQHTPAPAPGRLTTVPR